MAHKRKEREIHKPIRRIGSLKHLGVRALQVGEALVLHFKDAEARKYYGKLLVNADANCTYLMIAPDHYSVDHMNWIRRRVREAR